MNRESDYIIQFVMDYYQIDDREKFNTSRVPYYCWARQVSQYFLRVVNKMGLKEVAYQFNCNHATIIHSVKKTRGRMDVYPDFKSEVINMKNFFYYSGISYVDYLTAKKERLVREIEKAEKMQNFVEIVA